ncbi:DUF4914 family protein [Halanaerobiaceae bacterium ANBcell28]
MKKMALEKKLAKLNLPEEVVDLLESCPSYVIADSKADLVELSCKDEVNGIHEVKYEVPGQGEVLEVQVAKVKNGISANYMEPYMRRRDPNCMVIADDQVTDKVRYKDRFGEDFDKTREETFEWLKGQDLAIFFFETGMGGVGVDAMAIAPANAGFFAFGLSLLQGIKDSNELEDDFSPEAFIYVAPPFRHTHYDGKQVVVHNRLPKKYELFSYNLYPGPSAKKGVYGMLLHQGEQEDWVTLHCSAVQVVTPYGNHVSISHEGASGGGKSEMLEAVHREKDGRLLLGKNVVNGEKVRLTLPQTCELRPMTDDMAACPKSLQKDDGKLTLMDAENAWFIRVDHITEYGTDPHLEERTINNKEPLFFLNVDAAAGSTALIWEPTMDAPDEPCPNPRVVIPRDIVPGVIKKPLTIDIRSFGVRVPPCTKENPTYGIMGLFHVLPPALAWLWRLVAPRGHGNPSIITGKGMSSEGVGSYWPFATGRKVDQANLLLKQILETPNVRYVLIPNQHVGAWKTGFMTEWITREYLARRGGAWFTEDQLSPARLPLLGYALNDLVVEGQKIDKEFLQVHRQEEVGKEAYDKGGDILNGFFKECIEQFLEEGLDPLGRKIIETCLNDGYLSEYNALIESEIIREI